MQSRELGATPPEPHPTMQDVVTYRDELAAMFALALVEHGHILHPTKMAKTAYEMAAAMIEERNEQS